MMLFATILALRGRVTGRNPSRYCEYFERTPARQFRCPFDWPEFHQWVLNVALGPHSEMISAQDPSFLKPHLFSMASWKQQHFNEQLLALFIDNLAIDPMWVKKQLGYEKLGTYGAIAA